MLNYYYDEQIRRIILHFSRIFNGFQVRRTADSGGYVYETVPIIYGDGSAQAHYIINQASEHAVQAVPRMSVILSNIELNMEQSRYAGLTDNVLFTEKKYDEESGTYINEPNKRYDVERLVPTPVNLSMTLDVWTSNTDQKLQILEQILLLFNPMLEFQKSTNPIDWTAINRVALGGITFDNVGVPRGSDEEPMVMSLEFTVEAYISPPTKVTKQKLIETIITQIKASGDEVCQFEPDAIHITTPNNYAIRVDGTQVTLLGEDGSETDSDGDVYSWPQLIDCYGTLQTGFSKLRLKWHKDLDDEGQDIIGTIEYDPNIDNILHFYIDQDTLPSPTLTEFDMIIDPHHMIPNQELPPLAVGQRYLITDEVGSGSDVWGGLEAEPNDIIEYDGSDWNVVFDASESTGEEVIVNTATSAYLRFKDGNWLPLYEGVYSAGYWRLQL